MRRPYFMGFILILMLGSIPQQRDNIQEKLTIARPIIVETIRLTYDNVAPAILPLIGKITEKPKLVINGKEQSLDITQDLTLTHGQSLTAAQIDSILKDLNSPAVGTGDMWIAIGSDPMINIDAAYLLAIWVQESSAGTNKSWAGYKPDGSHTYNIGNMICAGYHSCYGRFRDYSTIGATDKDHWRAGIEDNAKNLAYYRDKMGIKTYDEAIMIWAPPIENNTIGYIENTKTLINGWRNINKAITESVTTFGDAQAISSPITADPSNDFGFNVKAALDANNSAMRNITISNDTQWSFNEALGNPSHMDKLKYVAGVYGGGWCDLACRYIQVFKGLGLQITHGADIDSNDMVFLQHGGIALNGCTYDESPYIWSAGKKGFDNGMQDLIVNNRTGKTIRITVIDNADATVTIIGRLE